MLPPVEAAQETFSQLHGLLSLPQIAFIWLLGCLEVNYRVLTCGTGHFSENEVFCVTCSNMGLGCALPLSAPLQQPPLKHLLSQVQLQPAMSRRGVKGATWSRAASNRNQRSDDGEWCSQGRDGEENVQSMMKQDFEGRREKQQQEITCKGAGSLERIKRNGEAEKRTLCSNQQKNPVWGVTFSTISSFNK